MHGALSALRPLILKRQAEAVQALKPQRTSASAHRVSTAKLCRRLFMSRPVLIQSDAEDHYRAKDN